MPESLKTKNLKLKINKKGFTFIEILVSISIIIIIATVSINYGNSARRQLALTRTQSQLVGMFNHAKSLSQNFLFNPPAGKRICAYGVHVNRISGEIITFNDLIDEDERCEDVANHTYDNGEELSGQINRFQLDNQVLEFIASSDVTSPDLVDVVFIPPIPEVIINGDENIRSGSVIVQIKDPSQSTKFDLRVNKFGQINIE